MYIFIQRERDLYLLYILKNDIFPSFIIYSCCFPHQAHRLFRLFGFFEISTFARAGMGLSPGGEEDLT